MVNGNKQLEEALKVASLTNPENIHSEDWKEIANDHRTTYDFVKDWKAALDIMKASEFKDMYEIEDAQKFISEKIYNHIKKAPKKREAIDCLIDNGNDVFLPLRLAMPSEVKRADIYKYCFDRETSPRAENIGTIADYMKNTYSENLCDPKVLVDFDREMISIAMLIDDFQPKKYEIRSNENLHKLAAIYGEKILGSMSEDGIAVTMDREEITYNAIKEIVKKYSKTLVEVK